MKKIFNKIADFLEDGGIFSLGFIYSLFEMHNSPSAGITVVSIIMVFAYFLSRLVFTFNKFVECKKLEANIKKAVYLEKFIEEVS